MTSVYFILFFVNLFPFSLLLPAPQEHLQKLEASFSGQENHDAIPSFDDNAIISVVTTLNWENGINISEISSYNSPFNFFTLGCSATSYFKLQGDNDTLGLGFDTSENVPVFEKDDHISNTGLSRYYVPDATGTYFKNISVRTHEFLHRNVDFSDLKKPSTIVYNVVIRTDFNITYSSNINEENKGDSEPESSAGKHLSDEGGLIPLTNTTGQDIATCVGTSCSSNTGFITINQTTRLSENVYLNVSKTITSDVIAFQRTDGANQTYIKISQTYVNNTIVMYSV